jgi:hypothetical protein
MYEISRSVIPIQTVECCDRLRLSLSDIRLIDGARLSAIRANRFLPLERYLVLISVKRLGQPKGHSVAVLGKLKKKYASSGIRTGGLPACSMLLQPTTLSRAPKKCEVRENL